MKKTLFLLFITYQSFCQIGTQSTPTFDPFVKSELDALNIEYTISASGNFRLTRNLENNRKQMVIINSPKYDLDGIEVREVWATSREYSSKTELNENEAYMLLSKNANYKFGAWQLDKGKEGSYILNFSVRVASKAKGNILKDIIGVIASRADEMEKELTNKDKY